jgi:hypothetical protein
MSKPTKANGINPDIEKHLNKLMKETMNSQETSLTDKMKIIDRMLKLEQLKQKMADDGFGGGFNEPDDD